MEPTTLEACETWVGKEPSSTSRYAYVHRIDPAVVYLSDHWTRVRQKPEKDERGLGN
jgi:hypothetical protein